MSISFLIIWLFFGFETKRIGFSFNKTKQLTQLKIMFFFRWDFICSSSCSTQTLFGGNHDIFFSSRFPPNLNWVLTYTATPIKTHFIVGRARFGTLSEKASWKVCCIRMRSHKLKPRHFSLWYIWFFVFKSVSGCPKIGFICKLH